MAFQYVLRLQAASAEYSEVTMHHLQLLSLLKMSLNQTFSLSISINIDGQKRRSRFARSTVSSKPFRESSTLAQIESAEQHAQNAMPGL